MAKQYDDDLLVAVYLKSDCSQTKAAAKIGCSRETVARAVRRKGIPMTGYKHNGSNQNCKITDAELRREAKTSSVYEIAASHGMSVMRVYRRARNINIKIKAGGGHWKQRADFYGVTEFDPSISLDGVIARDGGICQICGGKTDRTAKRGHHILGPYPTVDHIIPLSKQGPHTWDNVRLAHMACNSAKCDRLVAT